MLAAEYGWTLQQILELTVDQLNLFILTIGERKTKEAANSAIIMRMAVAANLSKEGAEVFHQFVQDAFYEQRVRIIKPEDFNKLGMDLRR